MLTINQKQRELLLEGLRYIRSCRRFEFRPTSAGPDPKREGDLKIIAELMQQLEVDSDNSASMQMA